jgi:hypothetical protein
MVLVISFCCHGSRRRTICAFNFVYFVIFEARILDWIEDDPRGLGSLEKFFFGPSGLVDRRVAFDSAVLDADDPVGELGSIGLMRHENDRVSLLIQVVKDAHDLGAGF